MVVVSQKARHEGLLLKSISSTPSGLPNHMELYVDSVGDLYSYCTCTGRNIGYLNYGEVYYTVALKGVLDNQVDVVGSNKLIASAQTANYTTIFTLRNNHLLLYVNSIATGGNIVITGSSLDETTQVPIIGDTETINVDTTSGQFYQSDKKWWEISSIDVSGTVGINYDVRVVGYVDMANRDWELLSYRLSMYADGTSPDIRFVMYKVQDDGNKKMSAVLLEDLGVDSGGAGYQIIDNLRTGIYDRSYNPTVAEIWPDNTMLVFKMGDFSSYFTADENIFYSRTKAEGMYCHLMGSPSGGISNVDFVTIHLVYRLF